MIATSMGRAESIEVAIATPAGLLGKSFLTFNHFAYKRNKQKGLFNKDYLKRG